MMDEWKKQAEENVLAVAQARNKQLTPAQVRRRVRVRLAFRAIGTAGLAVGKLAGGAIGAAANTAGAVVDKITTKPKP